MTLELPNRVLLLDGGLCNELNPRVRYEVPVDPLFTAKALYAEPVAILNSHTAYIEAGADIIETASYQATVEGFNKYFHCDINISEKLICDSVILAKTAVREFMRKEENKDRFKPLVAGSLGPYGAFLRDGSEYTGSYMETIARKTLEEMHSPRVLSLARGGADLIALETMPCIDEVEVMLALMKELAPEMNAWVSFSLKEDCSTKTSYGDSFESILNTLAQYPEVIAVGVNCCQPEDVSPFLKEMQRLKDGPCDKAKRLKTIVYPHSGQQRVLGKVWTQHQVPHLDTYVKEWLALGADIIGGCCHVGKNQIVKLRTHIDAWNLSHPLGSMKL